jgi:phage-related protein
MPTFPSNLIPQFPINEATVYNTLKTDIPYGPSLRRRKWSSNVKKRMFDLKFHAMPKKEMQLLISFYVSMSGTLTSFTWVHPETSTSYTVRFSNDSLSMEEIGEDAFDVSVGFLEVL